MPVVPVGAIGEPGRGGSVRATWAASAGGRLAAFGELDDFLPNRLQPDNPRNTITRPTQAMKRTAWPSAFRYPSGCFPGAGSTSTQGELTGVPAPDGSRDRTRQHA